MSENVLVLMTNESYSARCVRTVWECRNIGKYLGDIVIISHPELQENTGYIQTCASLRATPVFLPLIDIRDILAKIHERPFQHSIDGRETTKTFQWQKLQIFNTYFKKWKKLFYVDAGMKIIQDINIFFTCIKPNSMLAHCDGYPEYQWTLGDKFDKHSRPEVYAELEKQFCLTTMNYQSTILLFHTDTIQSDTVEKIVQLANKYPISLTNEQGIINLYFLDILSQVPLFRENRFLYDFCERFGIHGSRYTMLKYPKTIS
jgi:hypothetical protein